MTSTKYDDLCSAVRRLEHGYGSSTMHLVDELVKAAKALVEESPTVGKVSDGYHTVDDLYRHRRALTAGLFESLYRLGTHCADNGWYELQRSKAHHDEETDPMYPGYFIVQAELPSGQIAYHYPLAHWDLFRIPETDRAAPYDGHSADDAADRIEAWVKA